MTGVWLGLAFLIGLVAFLAALVRLTRRQRAVKEPLDPAELRDRREKRACWWTCACFGALSLAGSGDGIFRYLVQRRIQVLMPYDDGEYFPEVDGFIMRMDPWLLASRTLVILLAIGFGICLLRWFLLIRRRRAGLNG